MTPHTNIPQRRTTGTDRKQEVLMYNKKQFLQLKGSTTQTADRVKGQTVNTGSRLKPLNQGSSKYLAGGDLREQTVQMEGCKRQRRFNHRELTVKLESLTLADVNPVLLDQVSHHYPEYQTSIEKITWLKELLNSH